MHTPGQPRFRGRRNSLRAVTLFNYLLFVLFVIPLTNNWVDRALLALRAVHLEEVVGRSLQVWLMGSTLGVTALLVQMIWQNRKAMSAGSTAVPLQLEKVLVLGWWLVVIGAGAYGFMLGMGG